MWKKLVGLLSIKTLQKVQGETDRLRLASVLFEMFNKLSVIQGLSVFDIIPLII